MQIAVTDNNWATITYGYSPEHFDGVVEFYADLVEKGEIKSYTIIS